MFKGSIVALATPFTSTGKLDLPTLSDLVEWQIQEGTDAIVVCGTTGETPTLSHEEQKMVIETAVSVAGKRIPIIAGTGTYDTATTIAMTQEAKKLGVDGCLVIVPYYSRPSPEGCVAHFRELDKVGLPTILYHHPLRTGVKLSAKVIARICELPSIVGVKDGPSDMEGGIELQSLISKPLLSGDDLLTVPYMATGAVGAISVIANIIPRQAKQLVDLCAQSKFPEAMALYYHYYPFTKALFLEPNPQCLKYAMHLAGKCGPMLRLPLLEPQESIQRAIREAMVRVGIIKQESALELARV